MRFSDAYQEIAPTLAELPMVETSTEWLLSFNHQQDNPPTLPVYEHRLTTDGLTAVTRLIRLGAASDSQRRPTPRASWWSSRVSSRIAHGETPEPPDYYLRTDFFTGEPPTHVSYEAPPPDNQLASLETVLGQSVFDDVDEVELAWLRCLQEQADRNTNKSWVLETGVTHVKTPTQLTADYLQSLTDDVLEEQRVRFSAGRGFFIDMSSNRDSALFKKEVAKQMQTVWEHVEDARRSGILTISDEEMADLTVVPYTYLDNIQRTTTQRVLKTLPASADRVERSSGGTSLAFYDPGALRPLLTHLLGLPKPD